MLMLFIVYLLFSIMLEVCIMRQYIGMIIIEPLNYYIMRCMEYVIKLIGPT